MALTHTPAQIIRGLLTLFGDGSLPTDNTAWPIFVEQEPAIPDNCLTIYNTPGREDGRSMIDGELLGHFGFQVRIRAALVTTGYAKAQALQDTLSQEILRTAVTIDSTTYVVQAITRISDIHSLGKMPGSSRFLFTINGLLTIRQLS